MSIVKMKRIRLIAPQQDRDAILLGAQRIGCLHILGQDDKLDDPEWAALTRRDTSRYAEISKQANLFSSALKALDTYAPTKAPLFALRPEVGIESIMDPVDEELITQARQIGEYAARIDRLHADKSRLTSSRASLIPWTGLDTPLDIRSTGSMFISYGVCPVTTTVEDMQSALAEACEASVLYISSSDREQHYMLLVCHKDFADQALECLRSYAFSTSAFGSLHGTAEQCIADIDLQIKSIESEQAELVQAISLYKESKKDFQQATDRLSQILVREKAKESLIATKQTFFLEGWVSVPELDALIKLLDTHECAYDLTDPDGEEEVPVKLHNSKMVYPMNMVTEMYSLPSYYNVDPNPLIFFFFALFFGIMYADIGYGIIITIGSIIINKKAKPRGLMGQMMGLATICGITTTLCGAAFGSFFGDAIPVITETFGGKRVEVLSLIDPLKEPMLVLIGSLILGAIHILFGMCVKVYILLRDGKPLDALFDVGSWWIVFAGIALLVLGKGPVVVLIGVAMLILTQGRHAPTIPGKILGGLASLYDITGYLQDILSYSRLMALLLATSVVAQVVNILGAMAGSVVVYIIVFIIGHGFNMAINIIGTYVHTARLMYLEFFGKFYEDGRLTFSPLNISTKYVDVINTDY